MTAIGDQTNADPKLGALQNNGGPTLTMRPSAGSPAIDRGKSFTLTTDQRGAPRTVDFGSVTNATGGDGTDIGAFELGSPHLNVRMQDKNSVVLSWEAHYGDFILEANTNINSPANWFSVPGSAVIIQNRYAVTNDAADWCKLYRLKNH